MPYEIVHTIGCTVYLVLFVLFLWMSRVPRTNPGAGWWALATLFAFLARLVFLALVSQPDTRLTLTLYTALIAVEKLCMVAGLIRFFGLPVRLRWFAAATLALEVWVLITWLGDLPSIARSIASALFNSGLLAYVSWVTYTRRHQLHPQLLLVTAVASGMLSLHWLFGFVILQHATSWFVHGFLFGAFMATVQYLSLLAAVLMSFQKRLLEAESRALDLAFEDPLTGLSNQRYVCTLFDQVLALANRSQQLLAVFYIDLDNFKPINDQAGHAVGDEVLKTVARRLKQNTRSADICARVGGDEFVAICTQLEQPEQVHEIARKLLQEITSPITVQGRDYVLGASIGISLSPLHGNSLAKLLEYADSAMYEVKRHGKNGYRVHGVDPESLGA